MDRRRSGRKKNKYFKSIKSNWSESIETLRMFMRSFFYLQNRHLLLIHVGFNQNNAPYFLNRTLSSSYC